MNATQKCKKIDKNCLILFILCLCFFAADALKLNSEMKLRTEFEKEFAQYSEGEMKIVENISDTSTTDNARIDELSVVQSISSVVSVVILILLLIFWFKVSIQIKFISIALLLMYSAGMHLIDFEYLVQLSEFGENVQISKYLIVRLFPPVLFLLLFLTTVLYKPLPKPE